MSKDLWFANMERRLNELEDELGFDAAYERASNEAFDNTREQLADKADDLRQRRKEGL